MKNYIKEFRILFDELIFIDLDYTREDKSLRILEVNVDADKYLDDSKLEHYYNIRNEHNQLINNKIESLDFELDTKKSNQLFTELKDLIDEIFINLSNEKLLFVLTNIYQLILDKSWLINDIRLKQIEENNVKNTLIEAIHELRITEILARLKYNIDLCNKYSTNDIDYVIDFEGFEIEINNIKLNRTIENELVDYSNSSITEKIIALNELGILDFLKNRYPINQTSINKLAETLSYLISEKSSSIYPLIYPLNNEKNNQEKNPYNSLKTVNKVNLKLINLGLVKQKKA